MTEHRVELVQLFDACEQLLLLVEFLALLAGSLEPSDVDHQVLALGQELVQRRIDGANRHRAAVHRLEDAVEIFPLKRQQFVERLPAIRLVVGENHLLDDRDAPLAEEHVLGPAEADAARAELVGKLGLIRQVGVGADAQPCGTCRTRSAASRSADRCRTSPAGSVPSSTCRISLGFDATCAILTSPVRPLKEM